MCKSCRTCFMFYCMFCFICDRSFSTNSIRRLLKTCPFSECCTYNALYVLQITTYLLTYLLIYLLTLSRSHICSFTSLQLIVYYLDNIFDYPDIKLSGSLIPKYSVYRPLSVVANKYFTCLGLITAARTGVCRYGRLL